MPESEKKLPDPFSKSKRKRDMLDLQDLGMSLLELSASQLAKIPIPEDLLELLEFARTLKTHEAKRRHLQYIGKKMRDIDPVQIREAMAKVKFGNAQNTAQFHAAEEWRDRLIAEGDAALQLFLKSYPAADSQQLRQLIRNAQHDIAKNKNSGAKTQLFRCLLALITENN